MKMVENTVYSPASASPKSTPHDGAEFARQIGMLPAQGSAVDRGMTGAFNAVTKVRRGLGR
jgi:hypothetical protein